MKKQLLLFTMILLPLVASADPVEIDGIYYNLVSKTQQAEVTSKPSGKYSGSVVIPEKVTYESVEYSVTSIGDYAFVGCTGLNSVAIANSVTTIGGGAFAQCTGLISVTIPNNVTTIGIGAFQSCTGLTSVTIPNSVTSIGSYSFSGCYGLTSFSIPNSVTNIGGSAFLDCTGLTSIVIPNSVTGIGDLAFSGCKSLTSVTIPNSVMIIGSSAFSGCNALSLITIGSGITHIYGGAFAQCSNITDVYCSAEQVPTTANNAFESSYIEYATLHVPSNTVNVYKAAEPWKGFKSVVAIDDVKCEKPTISYENGKLTFSCATDGATYQYSITDADIKAGSGNEVQLGVTYNISVYATKSGYDNSETATATLCWIDASPKTEGITNGIANISANVVMIQSERSSIHVQGVDDGTQVNVYSINGTEVGSAVSQSGAASVNTNLHPGSIAIVKIGQKSVKIVVK